MNIEKKKANDEIEKTRHLIQDIAAESNKLDNDKNLISEQLAELQNQKSLAESQLQTLEDENRKAEVNFNQLIAEENEIKVWTGKKSWRSTKSSEYDQHNLKRTLQNTNRFNCFKKK
ncbi:MAG: hypothetical protein MZV64_06145 [Ignavibacteriales bacterium]|nr:hypothetical protein [Ignavibacteriales bacterium]